MRLLSAVQFRGAIAVRALAGLVASEDSRTLREVLDLVVELGATARPLAKSLLARLDTLTGEQQRREVAWALGRIGPPDPAFVTEFAARLARPDLRSETLAVLEAWGDDAAPAVVAIAALTGDPDAEVRRRVVEALVEIPGGALPAVQALVAEHAKADARPDVGWAFRPIGDLGPRLADAIDWLAATAREGPLETRAAALRALGAAPESLRTRTEPVLREALASSEPRLRECAAWSLFWPAGPVAVDAATIDRALADPHAEVRRVALMTLASPFEGTRDAACAARVATFLSDPDPDVRFWAGTLLERIGAAPPPDAVAAVRENLRSSERLVRLGALRTARLMGADAAPALSDLLAIVASDDDLGSFAIDAVAATGVLDDTVRSALRAAAERDRSMLSSILTSFGARASFLEPLGRAVAVDGSPWGGLRALAKATADPAALAVWLDANCERILDQSELLWAFRDLGPAGLRYFVAWAAADRNGSVAGLREHVTDLGEGAAAPLIAVVREAPPAEAALALRMLREVLPAHAAEVAEDALRASDPAVRAQALLCVAVAPDHGAPSATLLAAVRAGIRDTSEIRAAAFEALAALPTAPDDLSAAARAALHDGEPAVRVAACSAVFALTGDAAAVLPVLRAELNVPSPSWGYFSPGPSCFEDLMGQRERVWESVARVLAAMGPAGAPAAEDLVWAALRYGHVGLAWRLVGALESMGPAAAPVGPLLLRLVPSSVGLDLLGWEFEDDRKALAAVLRRDFVALGLPVPADLAPR